MTTLLIVLLVILVVVVLGLWLIPWPPPLQPVTKMPERRMPEQFDVLARYNAEKGRGIVHTAEWDAQMSVLQDEFNRWSHAER